MDSCKEGGGYKTFWPKIGGTKHFYHRKIGGTKHFSNLPLGVRNIFDIFLGGYETFLGVWTKIIQPGMQGKKWTPSNIRKNVKVESRKKPSMYEW